MITCSAESARRRARAVEVPMAAPPMTSTSHRLGASASAPPPGIWMLSSIRRREGGHHFLAEELHRVRDLLQRHVGDLVLRQKYIVADSLLLTFQQADHRLGATDESQTVVDPEVIRATGFSEHATALLNIR